jgi:hypothetical protein
MIPTGISQRKIPWRDAGEKAANGFNGWGVDVGFCAS